MPHVYDMVGQLFEPSRRNGPLLIDVLLDAALVHRQGGRRRASCSARRVGFAIAVVLSESRLLQRGFLPYIVASQTIPILAIAPMVVVWVNPKLPESLAGWGAVVRDLRLPDVLPGHDQHAARAPVGRPARGRADALVRREPLEDPLEAPRPRLVPVPLHGAEDRGARGGRRARSSASCPRRSRTGSPARSSTSTSTTSARRRASGRRTSSRPRSGSSSSRVVAIAERLLVHRAPENVA